MVLVERETFPRYHIGESLLPSCLEILELLGARDAIDREGFQRKPGADLDWKGEQWSLDFGELSGEYRYSYPGGARPIRSSVAAACGTARVFRFSRRRRFLNCSLKAIDPPAQYAFTTGKPFASISNT